MPMGRRGSTSLIQSGARPPDDHSKTGISSIDQAELFHARHPCQRNRSFRERSGLESLTTFIHTRHPVCNADSVVNAQKCHDQRRSFICRERAS